jgi:hypothetical protein
VGAVTRRTLRSFYDDQMTHHAAALTYYALMSVLFGSPAKPAAGWSASIPSQAGW